MAIFLFNFKKEFVSRVESGEKRQTIRRLRKDGRRPQPGDTAKLYTGLRTRGARLLGAETVTECMSVHMYHADHAVVVDGHKLDRTEAIAFARADGFSCTSAMLTWFRDQYLTDEFEGFCALWNRET